MTFRSRFTIRKQNRSIEQPQCDCKSWSRNDWASNRHLYILPNQEMWVGWYEGYQQFGKFFKRQLIAHLRSKLCRWQHSSKSDKRRWRHWFAEMIYTLDWKFLVLRKITWMNSSGRPARISKKTSRKNKASHSENSGIAVMLFIIIIMIRNQN